MAGHGEKYPRLKDKAICALLACDTVPEAAKRIGVGERTLWRWMKKEDFKEAFADARKELVRHAIARVQSVLGEAIEVLRAVMSDSDAPASARVSAAKCVIETALKATEIEELEERVAKLEELADAA